MIPDTTLRLLKENYRRSMIIFTFLRYSLMLFANTTVRYEIGIDMRLWLAKTLKNLFLFHFIQHDERWLGKNRPQAGSSFSWWARYLAIRAWTKVYDKAYQVTIENHLWRTEMHMTTNLGVEMPLFYCKWLTISAWHTEVKERGRTETKDGGRMCKVRKLRRFSRQAKTALPEALFSVTRKAHTLNLTWLVQQIQPSVTC